MTSFSRLHRAFTLIEVVISLAIMSFALVAVVGLLSVGLKTNKTSSDQLQAANIASLLISTIRAMPTNPPPAFALTNLNRSVMTNTVQIGPDGTTTNVSADNNAYNLYYVVGTNAITGAKLANVYLMLWWPLSAAKPTNDPSSYYEVTARVPLP